MGLLAVLSASLTSCDDAPPYYYVLCEEFDGNGWRLIDAEFDEQGYLMACTYQSPDRLNAYTARCDANGCD